MIFSRKGTQRNAKNSKNSKKKENGKLKIEEVDREKDET